MKKLRQSSSIETSEMNFISFAKIASYDITEEPSGSYIDSLCTLLGHHTAPILFDNVAHTPLILFNDKTYERK